MYTNNFFNSNGAYPILLNTDTLENNNVKLAHDSYDVYVNSDYVGRKELITQTENPKDVEGYLIGQGFHNFNTSVDGGSIIIRSDAEEAESIKRNLNVYLKIR
ncbi:MAG: hypothetical protein K0S75_426 [Clostridia bacterium]|jgi:hypothetical protein|nr:hypothetical protein [Clostridia bacterium]